MIKLLSKLFKILLICVVLLAISLFLYQKGWLKNHPLQAQLAQFQEGKIKSPADFINSFKKEDELNLELDQLSSNAGEQIKITTQKAIEAGKVAQEFISGSIKTDESSDKNLGEKAFEYGQYVYCRAVIDDWEQKLEENNSSTEAQEAETQDTDAQAIDKN
ncbi:MAG: hypothetical protein GX559_03000 [Candidatus Pacebacteria bacterium]|nr:hypothetical protein [Candidatus Paceibacterota bacterium]